MSAAPVLEIALRKQLGETLIDVAFTTEGRVTALFGPSGSGKTSIINMIAGIIEPELGRIPVGETILFDRERHISVPTHKRRIGYVFQDARLFPHLNVLENVDPSSLRRADANFDGEATESRLERRKRYWIADVRISEGPAGPPLAR